MYQTKKEKKGDKKNYDTKSKLFLVINNNEVAKRLEGNQKMVGDTMYLQR